LGAGIPNHVPAHTVTMACISSCQAATTAASMINSGQIEVALVGGAETMSDVPIRFHKEMRQRLIKLSKYKGPKDLLSFFKGFKLAYLAPEAPAIAEFSTGEVMGHSSDRLAARWGATREEQDDFAFRSHMLAAKAHSEGLLKDEITPVDGNTFDNGIKQNPREKYSSLKPAFVKPHGTHTAANSSFLSDGASAALIMSEDRALREGLTPKSWLADWMYVSQDPRDEMLLGPAYGIARLLHKNKLTVKDIDVFEIHEAFAGQVRTFSLL
jgi:acetyl-CoA acetyltransferase family protein